MDFQPQVLSQSDLNVEVSQSIRGATAWLFLASCHFIYEVLVFDKRISFMHRYQASSCLIIRHETRPDLGPTPVTSVEGPLLSWLL